MTLNQLKERLTGLRMGDRACISYDIYGVLFPTGEPDVDARARCYEFAKLGHVGLTMILEIRKFGL